MTTYILPQHGRPTFAQRIRAWWYSPTRAELAADRAAAQARTAELYARLAVVEAERDTLARRATDLQDVADQWDDLMDAADEVDEERGDLTRRHVALRGAHIEALIERDSLKSQAAALERQVERTVELYEEMHVRAVRAEDEAHLWHTAYAEGMVLAAPVDDDELATLATVTRLHPDALHADRTGEIQIEMVRAMARTGRAS